MIFPLAGWKLFPWLNELDLIDRFVELRFFLKKKILSFRKRSRPQVSYEVLLLVNSLVVPDIITNLEHSWCTYLQHQLEELDPSTWVAVPLYMFPLPCTYIQLCLSTLIYIGYFLLNKPIQGKKQFNFFRNDGYGLAMPCVALVTENVRTRRDCSWMLRRSPSVNVGLCGNASLLWFFSCHGDCSCSRRLG